MKTIIAIFLFAMVVGAMCQAYSYGYSSYQPGARVSHYASSGGVPVAPAVAPVVAPHYGYNYNYGAYPGAYRYW